MNNQIWPTQIMIIIPIIFQIEAIIIIILQSRILTSQWTSSIHFANIHRHASSSEMLLTIVWGRRRAWIQNFSAAIIEFAVEGVDWAGDFRVGILVFWAWDGHWSEDEVDEGVFGGEVGGVLEVEVWVGGVFGMGRRVFEFLRKCFCVAKKK